MIRIKEFPTIARNAATPYGLREHLGRYFLTFNGRTMPSQYGSMDRDTALRIYRLYRDTWTGECAA